METLRLFEPNLYTALPAHKLILTERFRDMFPPSKEQVQSGVSALLEKAINPKTDKVAALPATIADQVHSQIGAFREAVNALQST